MGWGISINTRVRGSKTEYYTRCDVCKNEHAGRRERDVKNAVAACENRVKRERREAEEAKRAEEREKREEKKRLSAKKRMEALEEKKNKLKERNERQALKEQRERERQANELRDKMRKGLRARRRSKKGRCPACNQQPCAKTRPKCAAVEAARLESSMSMDMSDPATFNEQMRVAKEMGLW